MKGKGQSSIGLETTDEKADTSCLVDVGCGSGQSTHLFAEHFNKVVGVDVSPDQLSQGREQYKHLTNVSFL